MARPEKIGDILTNDERSRWANDPEKLPAELERIKQEELERKKEWKEWDKAVKKTNKSKRRTVNQKRIKREKPQAGNYDGPRNKYTKIANEFIEAVYRQTFGHNQSKVLWYLVRKTWGWQKKSEFIKVTQMANDLKLPKSRVSEALSSLKKRRIVTVDRNKTYAIQMDAGLWRDLYREP